MSLSIIFITKRSGVYDILFNSLAQQTNADYNLICVDELTKDRHTQVTEKASQMGVHLSMITPSRVRTEDKADYKFGYANAINTGLLLAEGRYITLLQDFAWLPPTFVQRTLDFFPAHPNSVLGYPETFYLAPEDYINKPKFNDNAALSVFTSDMIEPPSKKGWKTELSGRNRKNIVNPEDAGTTYIKHWFAEAFCMSFPRKLAVELNGVDEILDKAGDDAHEHNITDRAQMLGYDIWIDGATVIEQIEHRQWRDDSTWHRSPQDTNISLWQSLLMDIRRGKYPLRAPNGFDLQ
jgi:glycosyltransferase involved in cell wall biosynthesis